MASQPLSYDAGWSHLLALSDDKLEILCQDLTKALPTTSFPQLAQQTTDHLGLLLDEARHLIFTLAVCRQLSTRPDSTIGQVVQGMVERGQRLASGSSTPHASKFSALVIEIIKNSQWLHLAGKLLDASYKDQNLFSTATILTDMRPIFATTENENKPIAAIIMHKLEITYREADQERVLYVLMDAQDLSALSAAANQAMEKQETLDTLLRQANVWTLL